MTLLRTFPDDEPIAGCVEISFPEPELSEKTKAELAAIDANIRAAHAIAHQLFLD